MSYTKFINLALDKLYERDADLLAKDLDVNELSITYRLAMHLQELLPELDVDCEYNRMGRREGGEITYTEGDYFAKTVGLSGEWESDEDDLGSRVFPDIIIHKRNTTNNFAIIEVKIEWKIEDIAHDILKLKCYIGDLEYKETYFILLTEDREAVQLQTF